MRVLGIDPGLSRCGVGVVQGSRTRPAVLRVGVIRTPAGDAVAQRLATVHGALSRLVAELRPDAVAVERVFVNANLRTAMGVGQAAGVALLCAAQAGVPVFEYTPTQVKSAVTGDGGAEKEQVGYMVAALLGLGEIPRPPDAADALALALCHLQRPDAAAGGGSGGAGAGTATVGGGMAPRLAAAVAAAQPGAQVQRRRRRDRVGTAPREDGGSS